MDEIAHAYQAFILTRNDEKEKAALLAAGARTPVLRYVLANAIQDPGSCQAMPFHNQVADQPGDFCMIQTNHRDWFLLGEGGSYLATGGYWLMDPEIGRAHV
jgi:hypothetical protein